jgi:hypothetical protein
MNTLIQKFTAYAAIVLAVLTSLNAKISTTVNSAVNILNANIATAKAAAIDTAKIYTDLALVAAKSYTDLAVTNINIAIAGINQTVFGGRTKEQWETYIANTVGGAITSQENRVKAMKEVSEVKIVKLADYTGDIAFSALAIAVPLGEKTTHMFKFQAPLGSTATTRNITGLPASVNGSTTLTVDNGDEIFVSYNADGTATIIQYDDNEAAVVAGVLTTQSTHGSQITVLESSVTALGVAFDAQAALVGNLYFQLNGYYAASGGVGTSQLG